MRLWTLHPRYLDTRGLVALWREALLAQAVLRGATRGYRQHPQLARFTAAPDPPAAIAVYLAGVLEEGRRRGYTFDAGKVGSTRPHGRITATRGQVIYEWRHLELKLRSRDPERYEALQSIRSPAPHPLFRVIAGGVEPWERTSLEGGKRNDRGPRGGAGDN